MSKRISLVGMAGAAVLFLASVTSASAQVQSAPQQKCLNAVNKDGAAVAKTQGKENVACLKGAGKGTLTGTAQACLTDDSKGKLNKAMGKTFSDNTKLCGTPPGFGYTSPAVINLAAHQGEVDLTADVFGAPLENGVLNCTSNKAGCACQQKVQKVVEQLVTVKLAEFVKCKKAALAAGAASAAALVDCVNNASVPGSIAADTKGKIAKTVTKLNQTITKSCDGPSVTGAAFDQGVCTGLSNGPLGSCLDRVAECRACQIINEMDDLFVNCDLFDDGIANATCASGTGPTPTPTATLTPIPTPTQTVNPGQIYVGAIARTNGNMNYDGVNGLPGAEIECDDHFPFPSTHVCTFAELEAAESAGELVGATDVNALPVTNLWAVIPTADPNTQCISTVGNVRWFYGTAHTLSDGMHATLNNMTGALSAVQTNTCNGGTNNGGPCTVGSACPMGRCGGPTVECTSGLRSVACCVTP